MGTNISKKLSSKYNQKLFDHAKPSATDAFKNASKRTIRKTAEEKGVFIGNKVADKIRKVSRTSTYNNLEACRNETESIEYNREISKEKYISPKKRQKIIDYLRLM